MIGTVVSTKMDKTAVVSVERRYPHPLYHKIVRKTKRYKAHDADNSAVLGDVVRIVETRPISKEKRWRIAETLVRGNVAEVAPREIGVPEESLYIPQAPEPAAAEQAPAEEPVAELQEAEQTLQADAEAGAAEQAEQTLEADAEAGASEQAEQTLEADAEASAAEQEEPETEPETEEDKE
jgi:small subunit ribosomal protein S17